MKYTFYRPGAVDINEFLAILDNLKRDYEELLSGSVDHASLVSYLTQLAADQRPLASNPEMGFWGIWAPDEMPSDARVDFFYMTTYLATSMIIHSIQTVPSVVEEVPEIQEVLPKAMLACTGRRFSGHGYDALDGQLDAMEVFLRAGVHHYLAAHPETCPEFTAMFREILADYETRVANGDTKGGAFASQRDYGDHYRKLLDLAADKARIAVFVYGTLMQGHGNHRLLAQHDPTMQPARLDGYALYQVASFPGIIPEESAAVRGEFYEISQDTLDALDRLEGEGSLYLRKEVTVTLEKNGSQARAYTYIWNGGVDPKTRISFADQPWKKAQPVMQQGKLKGTEQVWYACYGANTNQDYFLNTYIRGCSDQTPPARKEQAVIPHRLYFARRSPRWDNQGVAFVDPSRNENAGTLGAMYLITRDQFDEIRQLEGPSWYDQVLELGTKDGIPVYTFTHSSRQDHNPPCARYQATIAEGLRKVWGLNQQEADRYLESR